MNFVLRRISIWQVATFFGCVGLLSGAALGLFMALAVDWVPPRADLVFNIGPLTWRSPAQTNPIRIFLWFSLGGMAANALYAALLALLYNLYARWASPLRLQLQAVDAEETRLWDESAILADQAALSRQLLEAARRRRKGRSPEARAS